MDVLDQAAIKLYEVGFDADDLFESGIAAAEVIGGDTHIHARDMLALFHHEVEVVDSHGLGHLEHDVLAVQDQILMYALRFAGPPDSGPPTPRALVTSQLTFLQFYWSATAALQVLEAFRPQEVAILRQRDTLQTRRVQATVREAVQGWMIAKKRGRDEAPGRFTDGRKTAL